MHAAMFRLQYLNTIILMKIKDENKKIRINNDIYNNNG